MNARRLCWLFATILIGFAAPVATEARTLSRLDQLHFSQLYVRYLSEYVGLGLNNHRDVQLLFSMLVRGSDTPDFDDVIFSRYGVKGEEGFRCRATAKARLLAQARSFGETVEAGVAEAACN